MFKNAERDPLAIPSRGAHRPSMGPTHRTAGDIDFSTWRNNPLVPRGHAWDKEQGRFVQDPTYDPDSEPIVDPRPSPLFDATERHYDPERARFKDDLRQVDQQGWNPDSDVTDPRQGWQDDWKVGSLPSSVRVVLDREARAFMEREGNTDDRSELLYRARRHASTLTSTWSRDASEKVTQAFCGRVAALIPSRLRVAAAQPVTEFADFDDSLLY